MHINQIRSILEARLAGLQQLLGNREEFAIDMNADVVDQVQYAAERDLALGKRERESVWVRDVRDALRRIDLGTFGTCRECGEPISQKRLLAVPWISTCIECQEAADLLLFRAA